MRLRGARTRIRPAVLLALVVVFAGAAALGAYADWQWWMPYQGVTITVAVVGLFVVALLLATAPRARVLALAATLGGLGLLAGQNLGPARPELRQSEGTIEVRLTSPRVSSGQHDATCSSHAESRELQLSGDPNLRIEIVPDRPGTPAEVDQREILGFYLTVGDRWGEGAEPRSDTIAVSILVSLVQADAASTMLRSGPDSSLDLAWTAAGGTLAFSGLHAEEPTADSDQFEQIAGIAEWTCG